MLNINKSFLLSFIVITALLSSCINDKSLPSINTYIHISHTRTDSNPNMDAIVESVDLKKYTMLLLGGDLAYLTSLDNETMMHVDSIFDLSNENTLWSLGNHDYSDLNKIQAYTNRPPYYSYNRNNITYVVLDTQDSLSNIIGQQKIFFDSVIDTINESTHLVVLHHKLIWMLGNTCLEPQISSVSNGVSGNCFDCINTNNFYQEIYPQLVELNQQGIEVLCIGGDIGSNAKEFEYITPEGIYFLASGISEGSEDNKALVLFHDINNKNLTWEFRSITDL